MLIFMFLRYRITNTYDGRGPTSMSSFPSLRSHYFLKMMTSLVCLGFYGLVILGFIGHDKNVFMEEYFGYTGIFSADEKHISHFVYLAVCCAYLILMDWQHEYMYRLDYQWKRQLKTEQDQAAQVKIVNKMLLQNILPSHVAEVYLCEGRETGRLYSEKYNDVAVMFASIPDYLDYYTEAELQQDGVTCLKVLNDIISAFDKVRSSVRGSTVK